MTAWDVIALQRGSELLFRGIVSDVTGEEFDVYSRATVLGELA